MDLTREIRWHLRGGIDLSFARPGCGLSATASSQHRPARRGRSSHSLCSTRQRNCRRWTYCASPLHPRHRAPPMLFHCFWPPCPRHHAPQLDRPPDRHPRAPPLYILPAPPPCVLIAAPSCRGSVGARGDATLLLLSLAGTADAAMPTLPPGAREEEHYVARILGAFAAPALIGCSHNVAPPLASATVTSSPVGSPCSHGCAADLDTVVSGGLCCNDSRCAVRGFAWMMHTRFLMLQETNVAMKCCIQDFCCIEFIS
ncbi:uncharacterized protein LOC112268649 [Brachypodium distachyon]|uniref:Uncharacterized protein n=1 Tax=Brachypodium distachyon TaxID=15368 RepID=A0A2K2CNA5_BRADI|nr:uncharacterized protein LOC112268649 [Brachypodium distachyon]PNT63510.1 hypothetical protein BRADI_4g16897v3 [Brachypodium distachyon]|eukprot:XP_024310337.1 uncharacterized protein LOC112268649 [Brachypodium distachyon]